ncbi:hypothetical protein NBRC110019_06080 [Neptunitalea chrysea]|uniref:Lipopolysaccharide-assembly n=1 Tax=Neptunitalea chrysea TaxID=1647581 RepID=A0A9W6B5B4_9FLAO|nr:LptE family protein [Neptunitalea chrysea]GLB51569.1 hypothetical protein NBRC110019_06080 [Neptunitalea chrysea]
MKKLSVLITVCVLLLSTVGCGIYSFTGISTNAKSFQVNFFQNVAPIIEPGLDRNFTVALQDLIVNQTSLELKNDNAELIYEGEIVEYSVTPMSATASQTASQNRLTIGVNVRFTNTLDAEKDFEKKFSFYYDFDADTQVNSIKSAAFDEIFERITQDIVNASLADW